MAIPHAFPGQPVNLLSAEEPIAEQTTAALVKNNDFEAIRLVLRKGQDVCHHRQVEGPVTIQCLKGHAAITVGDETRELQPGHWLFLMGNDPHTVRGLEDSLLLLTIMFPKQS